MKINFKPIHYFSFGALTVVFGAGIFLFSQGESENFSARNPASIPPNYDSFTACDKQEVLWSEITKSQYTQFPELKSFGPTEVKNLFLQSISLKTNHTSDYAPSGWKKYIHARGAVAKVKYTPAANTLYTGLFKGAPCGLLRLSLTYKPMKNRPVAPGLALKLLRDGHTSGNISALYSLDGQQNDFNFFKNSLSNIVPKSNSFGQMLVSKIFSKVTSFPEEILLNEMSAVDFQGVKETKSVAPRQIFFKPNPAFKFSSDPHDLREDFVSIPEGTAVYQVFAVTGQFKDYDYKDYENSTAQKFENENSVLIGEVTTTSPFVVSAFGDDGLFFRHEIK